MAIRFFLGINISAAAGSGAGARRRSRGFCFLQRGSREQTPARTLYCTGVITVPENSWALQRMGVGWWRRRARGL